MSSSPGLSKDMRIIKRMGVIHVEIQQILLSSEFEVHLSCLAVFTAFCVVLCFASPLGICRFAELIKTFGPWTLS